MYVFLIHNYKAVRKRSEEKFWYTPKTKAPRSKLFPLLLFVNSCCKMLWAWYMCKLLCVDTNALLCHVCIQLHLVCHVWIQMHQLSLSCQDANALVGHVWIQMHWVCLAWIQMHWVQLCCSRRYEYLSHIIKVINSSLIYLTL